MAEFEKPPWVPDHEAVVDEPSFVEACKEAFTDQAQKLEWVFERSLLTRSQKWGLVWRPDFVVAGRASPDLINRAMCWGSAGGGVDGTAVGFGQRIAPLNAP
jgi:hypothetical protein